NLTNAINATIADDQGIITINNDEDPKSAANAINDQAVTEGNSGTTIADLTVNLTPASPNTVTVDFTTADGTATTTNGDYAAQNGTITFDPGQTTQTITIVINGDTAIEPNETLFVNLTNAINATIADDQGVITINND